MMYIFAFDIFVWMIMQMKDILASIQLYSGVINGKTGMTAIRSLLVSRAMK